MQRTLRMVHASLYTLCVLRVGGRLGRIFGSERAGRGCAVLLLLISAIALVGCVLAEVAYLSSHLFPSRQPATPGVKKPHTDVWGRDVRDDVHFVLPSLAYADLDGAAQAEQRSVFASIERRREAAMRDRGVRIASRILPGARDPNAFRLDVNLSGSLPRTMEALVDGLSIIREPGTPPLPQLQTRWRTYTPDELYERYDALDLLYTFVNGTESNHYYRKNLRMQCGSCITALEEKFFLAHALSRARAARESTQRPNTATALAQEEEEQRAAAEAEEEANVLASLERECPTYRAMKGHRNGEFLDRFSGPATAKSVDERDRETDELRHSLRSVEQHIGWHRGRVVIVSPGHHPTWVDGAKNFLAGVCGDATVQALRSRGTHLRLTTVHQDAVMPYGMRFTANSHTVEQHIWRVRNITPVHVYMNDDYFVNRDVAITDLFNEHGGTIVRTESAPIKLGKRGDHTASWAEGVANVELFNIEHLEHTQEDYLPLSLATYWSKVLRLEERASTWRQLLAEVKSKADRLTGVRLPTENEAEVEKEVQHVLGFRELLLAANTSFYWEAALESPVTTQPLPEGEHSGVLPRYYATHAPFVYCTNMFRYFSVRFLADLAPLQLRHRERMARDLFAPFLYNGFIMARPWEASAQFLPYLLQLRRATAMAVAETRANLHRLPGVTAPFFHEQLRAEFHRHLAKYSENASIYLDNEDGCAPATLYRNPASDVVYMRALDDLEQNRKVMDNAMRSNALYFNINAGFTTTAAANQVREFLHSKFPTANYLERHESAELEEVEGTKDGITKLFKDLMRLPIVAVVSYEEGVCPLLRSLPLAFAGHHHGRVHLTVQRYSDDVRDETLSEARRRLGHRVISALPATACSFGRRVSVGSSVRGENVADLASRVIGELDAGVKLPSTCGVGGSTLRVRGFVVDARTTGTPVATAAALREALAMPGQTLALEDFRAVHVGPGVSDVVLVLAREDATAKAVHWVTGASENDLLLTYPLPVREYEDMSAAVQWVKP